MSSARRTRVAADAAQVSLDELRPARRLHLRRERRARTSSSAAASTVPTSATVSVTLSALRSKTALWTSRTADRNRLVKARLPMIDEATDWIMGRAAIRSRSRSSTTSSVIRSAISDRTLSSRSATVARLANWSEFTAALRT